MTEAYTYEQSVAYVATLATMPMAACVLFRDAEDRVLLVKPWYRDNWLVPGGVVDAGERPIAAARREVFEEIGLSIEVGPLLVVDFRSPRDPYPLSPMFVFDGGILDAAQIAAIRVDGAEIVDHGWYPITHAAALMATNSDVSHQLLSAFECALNHSTAYLHDGLPPA